MVWVGLRIKFQNHLILIPFQWREKFRLAIVYDYPFSRIGEKVWNKGFSFQRFWNREMKAEMCCVFGRSHNDFVASESVNETTVEKFVSIMKFWWRNRRGPELKRNWLGRRESRTGCTLLILQWMKISLPDQFVRWFESWFLQIWFRRSAIADVKIIPKLSGCLTPFSGEQECLWIMSVAMCRSCIICFEMSVSMGELMGTTN